MGRSSIDNKIHNISNITLNAQGLKTDIFVGTGETNSLDWSWMLATQLTDILFGLEFMES